MSGRGFRAAYAAGLEALDRGDLPGAEVCIREVLAERPRMAEALCAMGMICAQTKRVAEGIGYLRQAVALKPYFAEAMANLGAALMDEGNAGAEAEQVLRQAMALRPAEPGTLYNLGRALQQQEKYAEAIDCYRQARALDPRFLGPLPWLRDALTEMGDLGGAIGVAQQWMEATGDPEARYALANLLRHAGRGVEAAGMLGQILAREPHRIDYHSAALTLLNYAAEVSAETAYQQHVGWHMRHAAGLESRLGPLANVRDPNRRLKVGYVSEDFRRHSVAYFLEGLLARHDHTQFEVYGYSDVGRRADAVTERLKGYTDVWVDTHPMSHGELAERVRADGIDVLVDLAGHTAGQRLLVYAQRAAPVQVTYLGYPNTTGLREMDYRLTDAVADPVGVADRWHSEQLVRLRSFLCYRPPAGAPEVIASPAAAAGRVTFGAVHVAEKVNAATLELWGRVLAEVKGSRLAVKGRFLDAALNRERVMAGLAKWGVTPERVTFLPMLKEAGDHLALYGGMDIVLDAWPYNGTTTTCDALWMGVPVVSLAGDRHVSRVGASILSAVGLGEMIAQSPEEFVRIAASLAGDGERMRTLRAGMRERLRGSVLLDEVGFALDVEGAYRNMWRAWCER